MKIVIQIIVLLIFFACNHYKPQASQVYKNLNLSSHHNYQQHAIAVSKRGNAFQLMHLRPYLGANNTLIEKGFNKEELTAHQCEIIDNVLKSAKESKAIPDNKSKFRDDYKGWTSLSQTVMQNQEVMLYEGYAFFYIAQFLYLTKQNGWSTATPENKRTWDRILEFVETNIWLKWLDRSARIEGDPYYYFLGRRTHMGSHWAGIGLYLNKLSKNAKVIRTSELLVKKYDILLKRNMRDKDLGYVWNSTYDNISGIQVFKGKDNIIQDISHGNHVVSYIVAAYEIKSPAWNVDDLRKISYALRTFAYDAQNKKFRNNIDGTADKLHSGNENFMGDGWSKLAKYDYKLKLILEDFGKSKYIYSNLQELQFKANLLVGD